MSATQFKNGHVDARTRISGSERVLLVLPRTSASLRALKKSSRSGLLVLTSRISPRYPTDERGIKEIRNTKTEVSPAADMKFLNSVARAQTDGRMTNTGLILSLSTGSPVLYAALHGRFFAPRGAHIRSCGQSWFSPLRG